VASLYSQKISDEDLLERKKVEDMTSREHVEKVLVRMIGLLLR
jgi:hypothetical protein